MVSDRNWLRIGGFTAAGALGAAALAWMRPWRSPRPAGKGLYLNRLGVFPDPETSVEWLTGLGLRWVAPFVLWQRSGRGDEVPSDEATLRRYSAAWRAAGLSVWPSAWVEPGRHEEAAEALGWGVRVTGGAGALLDVEGPWQTAGPPEARALMRALRARLSPRQAGVGVTSLARADWHQIPLATFAAEGAWGSPQAYPDGVTVAEAVDSYRRAGFAAVLPSLPAWHAERVRSTTAAELHAFLRAAPPLPGAAFWARGGGLPPADLARVIASWQGAEGRPVVGSRLAQLVTGG